MKKIKLKRKKKPKIRIPIPKPGKTHASKKDYVRVKKVVIDDSH
jgi:hypothetical protein